MIGGESFDLIQGSNTHQFVATVANPAPVVFFTVINGNGQPVSYNYTVDNIKLGQQLEVYTINTINYVGDYFPYGKVVLEFVEGDAERYISTQHERDRETGFDYRGARYYDSDVARFLSLDPHARDYASLSDYCYVAGNPLIFIDPDGKDIGKYSVDKDGNLTLVKTTESDEDYDMLYTAEDWSNANWEGGIRIDERSLLTELSSQQKVVGNRLVSYSDEGSKSSKYKLFKFMADNTEAEWTVAEGGGKIVIATAHKSYVSTDPFSIGIEEGELTYQIHSHPSTVAKSGISSSDEINSMGQFKNSGDKGVTFEYYVINNNKTFKFQVYFKHSHNLYEMIPTVNYSTPRFLKSVSSYKGLLNH